MNNKQPIFSMRDTKHPHLITGLNSLCDFINSEFGQKLKNVVEVGSFLGESASYFLNKFPNITLHCVDPWLENYDSQDPASHVDMKEVERRFDEWAKTQTRVKKWKGVSQDFAETLEFNMIDLVYIDGCHTYDGVKADIQFWKPRTKIAIAGHDYGYTDWLGSVTTAVDECLGKPDRVFEDSSWIKILQV